MSIKLVAVDLDGTLLTPDKKISDITARAVARACCGGIEVVLSTGRTYSEFAQMLFKLPDVRYAVACTGASVIDCRMKKELFCSPLAADTVREAWNRLRDFDMLFEVFQDGAIYVDSEKAERLGYYMARSGNPGLSGTRSGRAGFSGWIDAQNLPANKIHIFFRETAERNRAWEALRGLRASVCSSDDFDLEIMAAHVDKGSGLRKLAEYLRVGRSEIMAVGDSLNDLGMLRYAGVSVVMGNGLPEMRAEADIVADTNARDGVAKILDALRVGKSDVRAGGLGTGWTEGI